MFFLGSFILAAFVVHTLDMLGTMVILRVGCTMHLVSLWNHSRKSNLIIIILDLTAITFSEPFAEHLAYKWIILDLMHYIPLQKKARRAWINFSPEIAVVWAISLLWLGVGKKAYQYCTSFRNPLVGTCFTNEWPWV